MLRLSQHIPIPGSFEVLDGGYIKIDRTLVQIYVYRSVFYYSERGRTEYKSIFFRLFWKIVSGAATSAYGWCVGSAALHLLY
jgi:hypothetical protein